MSIYRRPAFWVLLLMWQIFAYLAVACLSIECYVTAGALHGPLEPWQARTITWLAGIAHFLFAVLGFVLAKRRMQHSPPPSTGFPVVSKSTDA